MREPKVSRRAALQLLGVAPALSFGLSACGKKTEPDSCQDLTGLSEDQKSARSLLQYVDHSPHADKHCRDCNLFQPPADPTTCGGCTIVKGPIHPDGYCTSYTKKV